MSQRTTERIVPQKDPFRIDVQHKRRSSVQSLPQSKGSAHLRRFQDDLPAQDFNFAKTSTTTMLHLVSRPESGSSSLRTNSMPGTDCMERCFRKLVATFLASDDSHFDVISCALSCVLVAVRLLSIPELIDATTTSLEAQDKAAPTRGMQPRNFLDWLRQREHPFHVDENLRITFEDENMPHFLRNIPIRGVDNTHRTLAMICLSKMQKCESTDARRNSFHDTSPLMDYAAYFWKHHCELAARNDNPDRLYYLENDVWRRYRKSIQPEDLNGTDDQRNFIGDDHRVSAALHPNSDWVFVKREKQSA